MNFSTTDDLRAIYRTPGAGAAGKSRISIDEASARLLFLVPDLHAAELTAEGTES